MKIILVLIIAAFAGYSIYWGSRTTNILELKKCLSDTSCYAYKDTMEVFYKDSKTGKIRNYENKYAREVILEMRTINKYYPLLGDDDNIAFPLVIICCSLSIIGTLVFLLVNLYLRNIPYTFGKMIGVIFLGLLMGGVAYVIVQFSPSLLFKTQAEFKDFAVYTIALLAGLFSEAFYNLLSKIFI